MITIEEFSEDNLESVKKFTDSWIGEGYYSLKDLKTILKQSKTQHHCTSFVAGDDETNQLVGIRLVLAPGQLQNCNLKLSPHLWGDAAMDDVAYFKSLFVHKDYQGQGIGKKLSQKAISVLKEINAHAIVCHSWLESPGNTSQKYLKKLGFSEVVQYPLFWHEIDYLCTRCSPKRCQCTAMEMIKFL
jgi:ribosomal protein S18 acetylase RimI-like enzyme